MSESHPTFSEIGESNIRERFGNIGKLFGMSEREDDPDDRKETRRTTPR